MFDVTVIVPTFNRAHFLRECLDSLLGQSLQPNQVIVVDDGSTDDTSDIVRNFGNRILYLHQENAGKATALNHGLRHVASNLVWIFDDDDLAHPLALARLVHALQNNPSAGFAFGRHDVFRIGANGQKRTSDRPFPSTLPDDLHFQLLNNCFCFQGAMLVKRSSYDAVGPFDTSLMRSQDYDMMLRLSRLVPAAFVDEVLFHQRDHTGMRGAAHDRIGGLQLFDRQLGFDAQVLAKAYGAGKLGDFLPERPVKIDGVDNQFMALLRRASTMGRRRLWREATDDLLSAFLLPAYQEKQSLSRHEFALLARIFDRTPAPSISTDNPVLQMIAQIPNADLRTEVRAAMTWPFFLDVCKAAARRDITSARRLAKAYKTYGRWNLVPRHLRELLGWAKRFRNNEHRLLPN